MSAIQASIAFPRQADPLNPVLLLVVVCAHAALAALMFSNQAAYTVPPVLQAAFLDSGTAVGRSESKGSTSSGERPHHAKSIDRHSAPAMPRKPVSRAEPHQPQLHALQSTSSTVPASTQKTAASSATGTGAEHSGINQRSGRSGGAGGAGSPNGTGAVSAPRFEADYLHNPRPAYPRLSRKFGEQGRLELRVLVSPKGEPTQIQLARSSGFERLDSAARASVEHWKFIPARRGSEAVAAWVIVPINFDLNS